MNQNKNEPKQNTKSNPNYQFQPSTRSVATVVSSRNISGNDANSNVSSAFNSDSAFPASQPQNVTSQGPPVYHSSDTVNTNGNQDSNVTTNLPYNNMNSSDSQQQSQQSKSQSAPTVTESVDSVPAPPPPLTLVNQGSAAVTGLSSVTNTEQSQNSALSAPPHSEGRDTTTSRDSSQVNIKTSDLADTTDIKQSDQCDDVQANDSSQIDNESKAQDSNDKNEKSNTDNINQPVNKTANASESRDSSTSGPISRYYQQYIQLEKQRRREISHLVDHLTERILKWLYSRRIICCLRNGYLHFPQEDHYYAQYAPLQDIKLGELFGINNAEVGFLYRLCEDYDPGLVEKQINVIAHLKRDPFCVDRNDVGGLDWTLYKNFICEM